MIPQRFDVFLCHNSEDKPTVIQIAQQLQQYKLKPWLDQWELRPGTTWQLELERQIRSIPTAAVFVGKAGIGPWQREEIYSLLQQFIQRRCPVIPVLLPDAPRKPDVPIFLTNRMWVDFRVTQPNPVHELIWGITGRKLIQGPTSQTKLLVPPQVDAQNINSGKRTLIQVGQPLAGVWQKLGKQAEMLNQKLDEFIAGSFKEEDKTIEPPRVSSLSNLNAPTQPLSIQGYPAFHTSALVKDVNRNYTKLQNLLRAGKWKEGNQETVKCMCEIIGRQQEGWLRVEDIRAFPNEDLKMIDQIWTRYSQGNFGFSLQKKIWQECGSPVDFGEKWEIFSNRVGWCMKDKWLSDAQLIGDLQSSPVGELPRIVTRDIPVHNPVLITRVLFKRLQS